MQDRVGPLSFYSLRTWVPVTIKRNMLAEAFITRNTWFALRSIVTHKGNRYCNFLDSQVFMNEKLPKSCRVRAIFGMLQAKKKNTINISIRANLASFFSWLEACKKIFTLVNTFVFELFSTLFACKVYYNTKYDNFPIFVWKLLHPNFSLVRKTLHKTILKIFLLLFLKIAFRKSKRKTCQIQLKYSLQF